MKAKLKFLSFLFLFGWVISACGDQTASVSISYTYDANAATVIGDGTGVTMRVFYSFDGLTYDGGGTTTQRGFVIEPASADFRYDTDSQGHRSFKQNTASDAGFSIADNQITLHAMALNHTGTFLGIDFLKQQSDGQLYVIATGCFQKSTGVLNKDTLLSYSSSPLVIQRGRNCGDCTTINDYGADPKTPCP